MNRLTLQTRQTRDDCPTPAYCATRAYEVRTVRCVWCVIAVAPFVGLAAFFVSGLFL